METVKILEVISKFDPKEKQLIRDVPEGLITRYEAKRWATISQGDA